MRLLGNLFYRYMWISFNTILFYFYRYKKHKHSTGTETVPATGPLILCSNHVNAFMDPILVGSTIRRRTWFLARSDVFRKKWLANFLSFIGIIPIYRLQEGVENLAKNDETFDKCAKWLEDEKAIIIFSEGLCVQERRLRKLKKGTARIALGSEEKNNFKLGLKIVPVGINYSATPWKFRSPVYISYGEPFRVSDYEELYRRDKPRAINQFTRDLEDKMKQQLLIIEDPANDELVAQLEEMLMYQWAKAAYCDPRNPAQTFRISRVIANTVNKESKAEPEKMAAFREKVKQYFASVSRLGVRDRVIDRHVHEKQVAGELPGDLFMSVVTLPFWVFGTITNYIPYKVPWLIERKVVKNVEWSASVNGTIGTYLWQIYWLLQSLVVALVFRNWYLLGAFMLAVPVCGLITQWHWVHWKKTRGKMRWLRAMRKGAADEILKTRKEIVEEMERMKSSV